MTDLESEQHGCASATIVQMLCLPPPTSQPNGDRGRYKFVSDSGVVDNQALISRRWPCEHPGICDAKWCRFRRLRGDF